MGEGRAPRPRFASECRNSVGAALEPLGFVAARTTGASARFDRGSERVELAWDPYDVLLTIRIDGVSLSRLLVAAGLEAEARAVRADDPPLADVARALVALLGSTKGARTQARTLEARVGELLREASTSGAGSEALLALGPAALESLLDAPDSAFWATEAEWRDFGGGRQRAIAAFAQTDLAGVLAAMKSRRWTDTRIALSGIGMVRDSRVVLVLLAAYARGEPATRSAVVPLLALQGDPRATQAVVGALKDRSSEVKRRAVEALGDIGDPSTVEALRAIATGRDPLLPSAVKLAIRKIRARRLKAGTPP